MVPTQVINKYNGAYSVEYVPQEVGKSSSDVRHEKTDLKVFVGVIPKEGWARVAAPILLLVWHRLLENMVYEVKGLKF